jgi:hypothetical protein
MPIALQVTHKKQNNILTNNKPPQPHKIEAQETKNLQQLVELQKLIYKSPNLPHQTEKKSFG